MKKNLVLITLLLCIIVFALPFVLSEKILEGINQSISILGGVASFVTLLIAVLLYTKYGVDKSIIEKNLSTTLSLMQEIKKTTIVINGDNFGIRYRPAVFSMKHYEDKYTTKLVFSLDYMDALSHISKYSDDLYLPKTIKPKLDLLLPYIFEPSSDSLNLKEFGKVNVLGHITEEEHKFDIINNNQITVYEFLNQWQELIDAIQQWVKDNSDSDIDLNIS
jgi:hypothetical protein